MGVTGWIQQKQIQGRTPASQVPQQQQAVMKIMPFFLPIISIGLPAGLVLYFAVSNTYRVAQQWFISRSIYGPAEPGGKDGDGAKPHRAPKGGGGTSHRQAEAGPDGRGPERRSGQGRGQGPGQRVGPAAGQEPWPAGRDQAKSKLDGRLLQADADQEVGIDLEWPGDQVAVEADEQGHRARLERLAKTTDDTSATPKPVLQPRARKKKE